MSAPAEVKGVLSVLDRARDVLAETYAKYQTRIGPFASQSQQSNVELRQARDAVAEMIAASRDAAAVLQSKAGPQEQETVRRLYSALARVEGRSHG